MTPIDVLVAQPGWFVVTAALVGLAIGSFLNVVIHRLPVVLEREWRRDCAELTGTPAEPDPPDLAHDDAPRYNLVVPRSHCPACWHQITVAENIPVLSYLWLRGRCSSCGSPISARYPLVELLTACLSGVVAWRFGFGLAAGGAIVLTWALIALTFIDLDTQLLPDDITLPFLWIGLSVNLVGTYSDLQSGVIGAIAGYGFFLGRIPVVSARDRQGRHGRGGLQAAGDAWRLAGLASAAVDRRDVLVRRGGGRGGDDAHTGPGPKRTHPVRTLLGGSGLDLPTVGRRDHERLSRFRHSDRALVGIVTELATKWAKW